MLRIRCIDDCGRCEEYEQTPIWRYRRNDRVWMCDAPYHIVFHVPNRGNINAGYEAEEEEGRIINGIRVIGLPDDSDSEIDDRIRLDTTAVMEGIDINYYESNVLGESVFIFLEFHRNFDGELTLYACDENGKRLASVKESVHAKAWDSGMHNFDFGKDFDSERSKYFSLCAKEE